jgi:hypothetical protein
LSGRVLFSLTPIGRFFEVLVLLDIGQDASLLARLGETSQSFFKRLVFPDTNASHYILNPLSTGLRLLDPRPSFEQKLHLTRFKLMDCVMPVKRILSLKTG